MLISPAVNLSVATWRRTRRDFSRLSNRLRVENKHLGNRCGLSIPVDQNKSQLIVTFLDCGSGTLSKWMSCLPCQVSAFMCLSPSDFAMPCGTARSRQRKPCCAEVVPRNPGVGLNLNVRRRNATDVQERERSSLGPFLLISCSLTLNAANPI